MSNPKLQVVPVVTEEVVNPSPAVGRFVTFRELEELRALLIDSLGHLEDTITEPDPIARIGNGCCNIRKAVKELL